MSDPIKKYVFSATFTVPDGFFPVFYNAADGIMDGEKVEIMLQEDNCVERNNIVFDIGEKIPVFPLLFQGEAECYISATFKPKWIVDNDKNCWCSGSHRFYYDDDVVAFVSEIRSYGSSEDLKAVREILNVQTDEPKWADEAREAGWTPPGRARR